MARCKAILITIYYDILSPDATINYTLTEDVVEGGTITAITKSCTSGKGIHVWITSKGHILCNPCDLHLALE